MTNTTTVTTIEAKEEFAELINRVAQHKERVILTRRDKEVAALISMEDFALLHATQNQSDLQDALEALKEVRQHGSIALNQLKEKIGYVR